MGLVKAKGRVGIEESNLREVKFLVDTGSFYTFLTPDLAVVTGISFPVTSRVTLADSRTVEVQVGVAFLQLEGREGGVIVATMDVHMPLLGVSALEALGLKVDPVTETLEHSRPFGPTALAVNLS